MPRVARLHVCSGCCRCECEEHLLNRPFGGNRKLDSFEKSDFFSGKVQGRKETIEIHHTDIFKKNQSGCYFPGF